MRAANSKGHSAARTRGNQNEATGPERLAVTLRRLAQSTIPSIAAVKPAVSVVVDPSDDRSRHA